MVTSFATATAVALGGNLGGITSALLGLRPDVAAALRLDVVVPVKGFKRCVDYAQGFEFLYPAGAQSSGVKCTKHCQLGRGVTLAAAQY